MHVKLLPSTVQQVWPVAHSNGCWLHGGGPDELELELHARASEQATARPARTYRTMAAL
jgi:hypothetical protein